MTKREIAIDWCKTHQDTPNKTLARLLAKAFPQTFTLASAYGAVRAARGVSGKTHLRQLTDKSAVKPKGWQAAIPPKSIATKQEDYVFPNPSRILVLPDCHVPFHDETAFFAAVAWGKKQKPTHVLLNGDFLDNYGVSRWEPDPRKRDVPNELKAGREGLAWLREQFPKAEIVFKHGNHENRIEHYLIKHAPSLLGVEDFELRRLLRFEDYRITEVKSLQFMRAGKLLIMHGHELPKGISNPVNPARGVYLRVNETAMVSHFHQTSQHSETTGIVKRHTSCWSTGALCDLSPDYAKINKWNHGFAFLEVDKGGDFIVQNLKIIDGKVF